MKTTLNIIGAILIAAIGIPLATIMLIALIGTGAIIIAVPEVSLPIIGFFILKSIPAVLIGVAIGYNIKK
jgi:hypothetical protein